MTRLLQRILVLNDGSPHVQRALGYAGELATAAKASVATLNSEATHGHASKVLLDAIDQDKPDLVVLTPHLDRRGRHAVFDGAAETMVATGLAPVLLLPSDQQYSARPLAGQNVLVLLDGSSLAESALPVAVELAGVLKGVLTLFKVVTLYSVPYAVPTELMTVRGLDVQLAYDARFDQKEAEAYLRMVTQHLATQAPHVTVRTQVQVGDLIEQIVALQSASITGLIVMATHTRPRVAEWLRGSTVQDVLRVTRCPLVLVHPTDANRAD